MTGAELLDRIPEDQRDIPHPDLQDETPRAAAVHVDEEGCRMCLWVLQEMAGWKPGGVR